jgi:hypothetical protein
LYDDLCHIARCRTTNDVTSIILEFSPPTNQDKGPCYRTSPSTCNKGLAFYGAVGPGNVELVTVDQFDFRMRESIWPIFVTVWHAKRASSTSLVPDDGALPRSYEGP